MKNLTTKRGLRCAIYTRVSTDQGLEQDFNSLDAQREASMRLSPRRHSGDGLYLVQLSPQSMHLPISGNQRAHVCLRVKLLPRRRPGASLQCSIRVCIVRGAFSGPLGRAIDRSAFSMMSRKGFMISIGMGKTTVEFCSAPISVNVWR